MNLKKKQKNKKIFILLLILITIAVIISTPLSNNIEKHEEVKKAKELSTKIAKIPFSRTRKNITDSDLKPSEAADIYKIEKIENYGELKVSSISSNPSMYGNIVQVDIPPEGIIESLPPFLISENVEYYNAKGYWLPLSRRNKYLTGYLDKTIVTDIYTIYQTEGRSIRVSRFLDN